MSDDVVHYPGFPLRGEKISIASPSITRPGITVEGAIGRGLHVIKSFGERPSAFGAVFLLGGSVALWSAPALVLFQYSPAQILDVLAGAPLRTTTGDLPRLFAASVYIVTAGLLVGAAAAHIAPRLTRGRWVLYLASAPLIFVSLIATITTAIPFFLGVLCLCFPGLI